MLARARCRDQRPVGIETPRLLKAARHQPSPLHNTLWVPVGRESERAERAGYRSLLRRRHPIDRAAPAHSDRIGRARLSSGLDQARNSDNSLTMLALGRAPTMRFLAMPSWNTIIVGMLITS